MKGDTCCGRIVVSGAWEFCPFCGKPLAEASKLKAKVLARGPQTKVVPLATQIPTKIAGKTHFLNPGKHDLEMSAHLKTRCLHVASRGKPKGKQCRLLAGHEGRHRYGK